MVSFIGIIPARYASTRFPGKPLIDIGGKSMIQHVYERVRSCLETVIVATDDPRIADNVKAFGGEVIMTSDQHKSGTDRCAEALQKYQEGNAERFDVVVNIQGDEPFIRKDQIELIQSCFNDEGTQIATLIKRIDNKAVMDDPNRPKVVIDKHKYALYFSRSAIPYVRGKEVSDWSGEQAFYKHIGMYAYRSDVLKEITALPMGSLEKAESLEQLRWLENGFRIKTAVTEFDSIGIDTPDDLDTALKSGLL